jgi:hypothetical protein
MIFYPEPRRVRRPCDYPTRIVILPAPCEASGRERSESKHLSAALHAPTNSQQLTNCSPIVSHFVPLCFQSLTTVKLCKPFVLITIRNARGWVGASPLRPSRKTLSHLISDPASSTLVPHIGRSPVRGFFGSSSTFNFELSTACPGVRRRVDPCANSFRINTCETPSQLFILKGLCKMLNPLDATLTKKRGGGRVPRKRQIYWPRTLSHYHLFHVR